MISKTDISLLVEKKTEDMGCFVVDITVNQNNNIYVTVDSDSGITIGQCAEINRYLEENLDRNKEDFSVEVTSPGIGKPFKVLRQYGKSVGREVSVVLKEGKTIAGKLLSASPNLIEMQSSSGIEFIEFGSIKETREIPEF